MIKPFVASMLVATSAQAQVQFSDQSANLPPHQYTGGWEHFVGGGVAVFDCDSNSLPDVFIAGGTAPAVLWRNTGDFTFQQEVIEEITGVTGAYPLDINEDGVLDLYVMRVGPDQVLIGRDDCTFWYGPRGYNPPQTDQWTTAFSAWWDPVLSTGTPPKDKAETSGPPPLLPGPRMAIGHYVDRSNPDGPFEACDTNTILTPYITRRPHMMLPDGRQRFFIERKYGTRTLAPGYCALSMLAGRDARGRRTLRISNDRHYYINDGHEQMWDITENRFLGPEDGWENVSLWGMGIGSVDLNGDGRDEVMLTSMGDQVLQLATPDGTYVKAPFDIGTYSQRPHIGDDGRPSTGWHSEFGDVNNDGRPDLFIAKGNVDQMPGMAMEDPNNLLIQQADGTFIEMAATAGVATTERSRGAALADFDQDGRLDLIVVNRRANVEIHRNETSDTGHWLRIDLRQTGRNYFAIGAQIQVITPERTQYRETRVGGGHAGGQALPVHVGLGDAQEAEIIVTWPDGTVSRHTATADQTLLIEKP